MKSDVHIWKRWLIHHLYWISLFFIIIGLSQSALALSASVQQANGGMCTFESFGPSLCNPGSRKNTSPFICNPKRTCCPCPEGTFIDKYNNCTECKMLRDCEAEGRQVLIQGTATHDTVCGDKLPTSSEGPMTTALPPAVHHNGFSTKKSEETSPKLDGHTSGSPLGTNEEADGGGEGTSVITFDAGSAVLIVVITGFVICLMVIFIFICKPTIPQRLNALLSKKETKVGSDVIYMREGVGEGAISEV